MTETRMDVFEDLLQEFCSEMRLSADDYDHVLRIARVSAREWRARYAAAPAEVVKVAKELFQWLQIAKELSNRGLIDAFQRTLQSVSTDYYRWLINNQDTFARAYLAWPNVEVSDEL